MRMIAYIRWALGRRWMSNRVLFAKSILYRGFSVMMTFVFSMVLTQNLQISATISMFDIVFKTLLYFTFEVNWNKLIKRM
jgi:uncharacterized membrane protein